MSIYDESKHLRGGNPDNIGQYSPKDHAEAEGVSLSAPIKGAYPFSPEPVDGIARVIDGGENQICECGNDSETDDWVAADRNGRLNPDSLGSGDEEEYAVCPDCGRVYSNADLIKGDAVAVTRYDTGSSEFKDALSDYNVAVYGG
jgi:hypothetical protein